MSDRSGLPMFRVISREYWLKIFLSINLQKLTLINQLILNKKT